MHKYTILGRPVTTTNSMRIVMIPTVKKADRRPGEEIRYRPMIMKSKQAAAWAKSADPQLKTQRGKTPTIECVCDVELEIYRAINSGDADNYAKGVLDAIAHARIIRNDRLFKKVTAEKFTDPSRPRIEVRIIERPHTGLLFELEDPELPEEIEEVAHASVDDLPDAFLTPDERAERAARLGK